MIEGPIGAAAFNNEFGRPNIAGYFRNFEFPGSSPDSGYGYHKPIMLAGGLGNIRPVHVKKEKIPDQAPIVVIGGPTMLIGLGGGAASSVASGSSSEELDFASVQRGNPEMQRRCQEVIDACCGMGEDNPILSIHDVGAGGLCNALPELVHDSGCGGTFELRDVLNDEPGMSPMQIWCNESQERYVVAVKKESFREFEEICRRERCLYAQVGMATETPRLELRDRHFSGDPGNRPEPINLPVEVLFGLPPKMHRKADTRHCIYPDLDFSDLDVYEAVRLVLGFPAVADKTFLVTIGDRSVTGLIARDQMVGPWQVPVADVAVTSSGFRGDTGEAFAVGERTPLAILDAAASGRMAIGESVTNLAAADIGEIGSIRLSANWMVASGEPGHDVDLYKTVQAVASELCPALGISIPVGKDSMSMKTVWQDDSGKQHKVVAPMSLVVSAFATVGNVRLTLTPQMRELSRDCGLWLIDLGQGRNRLGGSVLAQATGQIGNQVPDLDNPELLKQFFILVQTLISEQLVLAYHDRSDGGLMATLMEMAFASRCGLEIDVDPLGGDVLEILFSEELGAVIQAPMEKRQQVEAVAASCGLGEMFHFIGRPGAGDAITIRFDDTICFQDRRSNCHRMWSETTWQMQRLRDNPACADQEYDRILDTGDGGLFCDLGFDWHSAPDQASNPVPMISSARPKIAILREQGVNGQLEMAAAFDTAGFEAIDVTMSDLAQGKTLDRFTGFAACGGFSFGDVLGAGEGWGKSVLYNPRLKEVFQEFFGRLDTFALGVCNGCQMMSSIKNIIPGAAHWPRFVRNESEQYEARFVMIEVCSEKSIMFAGMAGSRFPVAVAHGEGRASFGDTESLAILQDSDRICLRFIDHAGNPAGNYPLNPNGSPQGVTGFTNDDGRFTIMMPHPERVFRAVSNSWYPDEWGEFSPWIKIFCNARKWLN
jgi:phosphoribosylformylglycinamidine synthase